MTTIDPATLQAEAMAARAAEANAVAHTSVLMALDRASATAEGVSLLAEKLAGLVKITTDEAGHRHVAVTGLDGAPLQSGYAELVDQAAKKWPSLFLAKAPAGSGAPTRGGHAPTARNTITRTAFEALPPAARGGKIAAGVVVTD